MALSLRYSEKYFRLGLWLVALAFAGFLIGLGSMFLQNMPHVEQPVTIDDFIDRAATGRIQAALSEASKRVRLAGDAVEQARLRQQVAEANLAAARDGLSTWLATRHVTGRPDEDPEVLRRAHAVDELRAAARAAEAAVQAQQQAALNAAQAMAANERERAGLESAARALLDEARRRQELRVFGYRVAVTLPLLVFAGFLFRRCRKSLYWPFAWGFIFFALFAFFVELVPYLPSYGGYVRYGVGIIVTAIVGRQVIVGLQTYLTRQQLAERTPDMQRREQLSYDKALACLHKGICPGCERAVDLKNAANDFCSYCGICLNDHCARCNCRKNAFARYCHSCGMAGTAQA